MQKIPLIPLISRCETIFLFKDQIFPVWAGIVNSEFSPTKLVSSLYFNILSKLHFQLGVFFTFLE
jgi:hypothetical protein